jgi:hypothetical protein
MEEAFHFKKLGERLLRYLATLALFQYLFSEWRCVLLPVCPEWVQGSR